MVRGLGVLIILGIPVVHIILGILDILGMLIILEVVGVLDILVILGLLVILVALVILVTLGILGILVVPERLAFLENSPQSPFFKPSHARGRAFSSC